MIAAGNKACARRRAQRGRVHVVVTQTVLCEAIQIGCLAGSAEATELPEAHVIENDEQDIRRALFSPQWLGPRGAGDIERASNDAGECSSWFVFFKCQFHFLLLVCSFVSPHN